MPASLIQNVTMGKEAQKEVTYSLSGMIDHFYRSTVQTFFFCPCCDRDRNLISSHDECTPYYDNTRLILNMHYFLKSFAPSKATLTY